MVRRPVGPCHCLLKEQVWGDDRISGTGGRGPQLGYGGRVHDVAMVEHSKLYSQLERYHLFSAFFEGLVSVVWNRASSKRNLGQLFFGEFRALQGCNRLTVANKTEFIYFIYLFYFILFIFYYYYYYYFLLIN